MPSTSPGYSITVRVEVPAGATATAALTGAVGSAGGALTALDVVESQTDRMVVDVTCDTSGEEHADVITRAIAQIPGASVRKVSDRTFLMHLGGKIEVTPKVPLKHRDDLSRAYTPGVARVCLAIAAHPEDELTDVMLRRAMAHATVLASFNVAEFGTERIERLTGAEIMARIRELQSMTEFSGAPLKLRG